jgi:hypothetical protein
VPAAAALSIPEPIRHKALWEVKGGKLVFHLHEGQTRAWNSQRRFTFVIAGAQSGKTSFGPVWLWREIQRTADPAGGTNDYIAATASFDLFNLKMLPEMKVLFEETLGIGRYWSSARVIELRDPTTGKYWANRADDRMWGRIILRSAAAKGGLESATARGAWLDECGQDEFTLETWGAVRRRLALFRGRVLGTTTPYNLGWLKTEIWDRWQNGDPNIAVVNFKSTVNPNFSEEEMEELRATMPLWLFEMMHLGILSRPAGMIFDCWDDDENLVDDFPIPGDWPVRNGLDFGGVNTATLWIAEDPATSIYYAFRESLEGSKTTKEHVEDNLTAAKLYNVVGWWGGSGSEDQQRRDWKREGIAVREPLIADVEGGITRVYGLIKPRKLKVFRSLRGLRDEIGGYKRKLDDNGQVTKEIVDKRKFHRLDALRYVSSALDVQQVRFRPLTRSR